MKDGPNPAVPPLAAGDLYLYAHGNGAIFLLEHDGRSRLVTLPEALQLATACQEEGARFVVGADEGPLGMEAIERIVASGVSVVPFDAPSPPHQWPNGTDALMEAASVGSNHILDDLIDRGAELDRRDESGSTALHHAAAHGNVHAVESLVGAGADPNLVNARGMTPHMAAMATREFAVAERLAGLGADTGSGARDEVRFSRGHYGTVAVWFIQPVGIMGMGAFILWPLSLIDVAGLLALLVVYVRVLYPPRAFWSGGIPRRLRGTTLTLRRFTGQRWDLDLGAVSYGAVGGTGRSNVLGARWLLLGHPSGHPVSARTLRRLHLPDAEAAAVAARMDRVVVVPAEAGEREKVLLSVGNVLSGRGVDLSPTLRQQLADARADLDTR